MFTIGTKDNLTVEEAIELLKSSGCASSVVDDAITTGCAFGKSLDSDELFFDGTDIGVIENDTCAINGTLYARCDNCETWYLYDDGQDIGGSHFCDYDCAYEAGFEQCNRCGEWLYKDDAVVTGFGYYCDEYCAERDGLFQCCDCGEWFNDYDAHEVRDHGTICESCYGSGYYGYCECCEEFVTEDDYYGDGICCSCHNEYEHESLHEYGYTPNIEMFGSTDGNTKPYLGIELETDGGEDRVGYVDELDSLGYADRFWMTKDGSLDNGVEVTSQPMTLDEHIKCGMWEEITNAARAFGFKSHDGGRCGLHVHINRDFFGKSEKVQSAGGYKMMRLMQRFQAQFVTFSRRVNTRWCSFSTYENYSPKYNDGSLFEKSDKMCKGERAHAQAVNFEHRNTFEIRIFRGTLNIPTLYASFGLANGIARACKSHGEAWIESVNWYDLMAWIIADCDNATVRDHLKNYLTEKELY